VIIFQTLNLLWHKKKRSLGKRLQKGVSDLAVVLQPVSEEHKYIQKITDNEIQWVNRDGRIKILFFYIPDPRNHASVSRIYRRTKDVKCSLSCIFVHQWMAGFGNWDVFTLHPQTGLRHWNRFWGQRYLLNDAGPHLRDDTYSLFKCGQDYPLISQRKWAKMLAPSKEKTIHHLGLSAAEHSCSFSADRMIQGSGLAVLEELNRLV